MTKTYVKGTISNCDDGIMFNYLPYGSFKFSSVFLPKNSEVMVNLSESSDNENDDFYKVCIAAGIEGYLPKKYISFHGTTVC